MTLSWRVRCLPYIVICILSLSFGDVAAQDSCITNPSAPSCATYQVPTDMIKSATAALCSGGMASMPGCTINTICQNNKYSKGEYCQPFSVYVDICEEMPNMANCTVFKTMCSNISVVQECNITTISLPTTTQIKANIDQMCELMDMPACSACDTSCNYLEVYSDMCISMPDMSGCDQWKLMCKQIPNWPLCSSESIPAMQMFFHFGITDYILFKSWVPSSTAMYIIAWLAIFFFTVLYEVIKLFRSRWEKKWADQLSEGYTDLSINGSSIFAGEAPFRMKVDFARATLHLIEVTWGFLVMLVVMTYNVGLFLAVLAGSFFGMLFIGRFVHYTPKASCH